MILSVIPARNGSKGLKNKNFQIIEGKTLVEHAINVSPFKTVVTSNTRIDCEVDFILTNDTYLHSDGCRSIDVWKHAWMEMEKIYGIFEGSVLLEPSSPMRVQKDIIECVGEGSVCTVSPCKTPHKSFKINDGVLNHPDFINRRQDSEQYYAPNGLCYFMDRDYMMSGKDIFDECIPIITKRKVISIDDEDDLKYARFLMSRPDYLFQFKDGIR